MKNFAKIIVAAIVAAGMALVLMMHGASDNVVIMTYLCAAIMLCALFGVFDERKRQGVKHTSIKDAARYGQAAIFVGTAAIFVGEPQECEEMADDMLHYAQQCEARALNGTETFDVL